jgi:hypothetical protein
MKVRRARSSGLESQYLASNVAGSEHKKTAGRHLICRVELDQVPVPDHGVDGTAAVTQPRQHTHKSTTTLGPFALSVPTPWFAGRLLSPSEPIAGCHAGQPNGLAAARLAARVPGRVIVIVCSVRYRA